MKLNKLLSIFLFLSLTISTSAQRVVEMNIWNGRVPHPTGVDTDTAKMRVYLPDAKRATGRAIVICPGGAYAKLSMENEGTAWAPFFNDLGIAAIVLKYRLPNGVAQAPISDAEQAMRLVRQHAQSWHINRNDVGIMGSWQEVIWLLLLQHIAEEMPSPTSRFCFILSLR